jgi:CRISPR/Cas system CSM-associated protein Csm3 (group 7 of RAMP superfamily)
MKTYKFHDPRWIISAVLYTHSPLHIGCSDTTIHPKLPDVKDINACIKDHNNKPYIPGATLKGDLLAWLRLRMNSEHEDLIALFGKDSKKDKSGSGGRAEFHDAYLKEPLKTATNYPYWRKETQTYVEISTVINQATCTVAHRKLFHTEVVPPGVGFKVIITGMMSENQSALLIAALQAFNNTDEAATIGAETASGKGRMSLFGNVQVACMDAQQVRNWLETNKCDDKIHNDDQQACNWLDTKTLSMAGEYLNKISKDRVEPVMTGFDNVTERDMLELIIQMDGPFLINNPEAVLQEDAETDHQPLLDADGKPLLSGKSLRGALRSQAERIVRSLGLDCCDTLKPCPSIYKQKEVEEKLCPVCQVFGATGWQSPLHIHHFEYDEHEIRYSITQDFVAIDRFHGGGKQGAKFNASFYFRPKFKGFIELDQRLPNWGKGLLALVLRDLKEGDIKLGFGANKGYGGVKTITPYNFFTNDDIGKFKGEFRAKFNITDQTHIAPNNAVKPAPVVGNPQTHTDCYFYNPYQFIPVKAPNSRDWLNKGALNTGQHHHSHALYRQQTESGEPLYHGRLWCKLTTETPFFIGAKRMENTLPANTLPAKVENYTFDGEFAIPATSLRGMISSLAEAASNAALRVLDNGLLSYRKTMKSEQPKDRPLSAIGMVIGQGNDLKLIPLALPTLELNHGYYQLPSVFRTMFPDEMFPNNRFNPNRAALKVYLNRAYDNDVEMARFLANKKTWTPDHPEIYYLNLDSLHLKIIDRQLVYSGDETILRRPANTNFVIGQNSIPANSQPIPEQQLSDDAQKNYLTPGILRILGKEHRETEMPRDKKHELFIPVPREFAENFQQFIQTATAFTISPEAIERFNELAKQRTDSQDQDGISQDEQRLPYHLRGTAREFNHTLRLKYGDLVYFRPDDHNHNIVAEVSFSAIWRGRVEKDQQQAAKVFDFFFPNLLPFNSERTSLSPAELLFGFIEGENAQGKKPENALAFAGKVRIDTGRLTEPKEQRLEPEITLKILYRLNYPRPRSIFGLNRQQHRHISPNMS